MVDQCIDERVTSKWPVHRERKATAVELGAFSECIQRGESTHARPHHRDGHFSTDHLHGVWHDDVGYLRLILITTHLPRVEPVGEAWVNLRRGGHELLRGEFVTTAMRVLGR